MLETRTSNISQLTARRLDGCLRISLRYQNLNPEVLQRVPEGISLAVSLSRLKKEYCLLSMQRNRSGWSTWQVYLEQISGKVGQRHNKTYPMAIC